MQAMVSVQLLPLPVGRRSVVNKYISVDRAVSSCEVRVTEVEIGVFPPNTRAMLDFEFGDPVAAPMLNLVGASEEEEELKTMADAWASVFVDPSYQQTGGAHMLIKTHPEELADKVSHFINMVLQEKENRK